MVNPEHLELLKQGVDEWNAWREANQFVRPDFSHANLSYTNLAAIVLLEANLSGADLSYATLSGAKLSLADLSDANLSHTDLTDANLTGANLTRAYLSHAKLSGGDLTDAKLSLADLSLADFSGADLKKATLWRANLDRADLQDVNFFDVNLSEANLSHANLSCACLSDARLFDVNLSGADLYYAILSHANLSGSDLSYANLEKANLSGACLRNADMSSANLSNANLTGADLQNADLTRAIFIETDVTDATFTGCKVYGISAWNLRGEPSNQNTLHIARELPPYNEPVITVDNLEVAQFIYMLIKYEKLRDVIKTITSKMVLILGRFTPERKRVLDALADAIRSYRDVRGEAPYLSVLFDFPPDPSRDLLETAQVLAGMAHFIVADITTPNGVLVEVANIIPHWKVAIALLLDTSTGERPPAMLAPFASYPWVVCSASGEKIFGYTSAEQLCASLEQLIDPLERKVASLEKMRHEQALGVTPLG